MFMHALRIEYYKGRGIGRWRQRRGEKGVRKGCKKEGGTS
jgi:hypothetical protein